MGEVSQLSFSALDFEITFSEQLSELFGSLAKARKGFHKVIKSSNNPFFKSKYADLAELLDATTDSLSDNGLAVMQFPVNGLDNRVAVVTRLCHESGQWAQGKLSMPISKADAQGIGSAITYGRRYSYGALLNIASEEDDDGNAAGGKRTKDVEDNLASHSDAFDQRADGEAPLAPFQQDGLRQLCKTHGRTDEQLIAYMKTKFGVDRIEKVLRRDFETLKKWVIGRESIQETLQTSVEAKTNGDYKRITAKQVSRLYAIAGQKQVPEEDVKRYVQENYNLPSPADLSPLQYDHVCRWLESA